jgi:hypothetical protein
MAGTRGGGGEMVRTIPTLRDPVWAPCYRPLVRPFASRDTPATSVAAPTTYF